MIKNKVALEIKKEERIYEFVCTNDSPLGEIHDALTEMKNFVIAKMRDAEKPPACDSTSCEME